MDFEEDKILNQSIEKEEFIREKLKEFENIKGKFKAIMDKAPELITAQYYALKDEEIAFLNKAKILGIPFNMSVENSKVQKYIAEIKQNIEKMNQKIKAIEEVIPENERYAMAAIVIMHDFNGKAVNMRVTQNLLMDTVKYYSDSALFDTKKGLDEKVQKTIKETKLKLLARKKKELVERKISWLGRLRGVGKLRDIEIANIELEEQILKNSGIKVKSEYSVQDTLADMRAFSIRELDGQNTEEMEAIIQSVGDVFSVHQDVIEDRARRKINAVPMVIVESRKRIRISEKIAKAEKRNEDLRTEFIDTYNSYGIDLGRYTNDDSLEKFYNLLDEAVKDTKFEYSESAHRIDKNSLLEEYSGEDNFGVK